LSNFKILAESEFQ